MVLEVVAPQEGVLYAVLKDEGETVLSEEKIGVLEVEKQPYLKMDDRASNLKSIGDLIRAQMNN